MDRIKEVYAAKQLVKSLRSDTGEHSQALLKEAEAAIAKATERETRIVQLLEWYREDEEAFADGGARLIRHLAEFKARLLAMNDKELQFEYELWKESN